MFINTLIFSFSFLPLSSNVAMITNSNSYVYVYVCLLTDGEFRRSLDRMCINEMRADEKVCDR